jgi:hypothetical protein
MSDEGREGIERRADITRFKLMRTLQALDRKRHEILDVRQNMHKHVIPLLVVSLSLAFSLGGAVAVLASRTAQKGARLRRERWEALVRALRHPERVARGNGVLALPLVARKLVPALVTTIAVELAKRLIGRLVTLPRKRDVAFDTPRAIRVR